MTEAGPGDVNDTPQQTSNGDLRALGPHDDDALTEALEQISAIVGGEEDRRKTTDAKLSPAQSAIGFIVTLASGSIAVAFLQTPIYDLWHDLVGLALLVSVGFFVWAAVKVAAANDPAPYQTRLAASVLRLLDEGKTKQELKRDAINDLISNVEANTERTDKRLTLYRAAIENIQKGVISAGLVPVIVMIGYTINTIWSRDLPQYLQLPHAISSPAPSSSPSSVSSQPPNASPIPSPIPNQ